MFRIIAAGVFALAVFGFAHSAQAQSSGQEVNLSQQHLDLARQVFVASNTGRSFDQILPEVADRAKATFINRNPQIQLGVIEAVDRVALDMVSRRSELDDNLVRIWALAFTEEELAALLQFYQSPAGQKFSEIQPKLISTQLAASDNWTIKISNELARRVQAELARMAKRDAQNLRGTTSETTDQ